MKLFLKKVIIFLTPIILVWGGVDFFYQVIESNYSYKHRRVQESYSEIETLVLGDSHAFFGLDPKYLDSKAFNLSNISQSLYFDQLLIEKHIDSIPNLKNIIITIGYYSLSQKKNVKEDIWRKYFYYHQMDLEIPFISPFDIRKYSLASNRRFCKSVDLIKKYIKEGSIVGCDANGWGNYYDKKASEVSLEEESRRTAKKHEDFLLDFGENLDRLQTIIDYCKKIDCNVYLIEMPVYQSYLDNLNPEKLQKIEESCNKLVLENDNVTYINLRRDNNLEVSDLYDPDHLNHKGAKKYTLIINEVMINSKNDN